MRSQELESKLGSFGAWLLKILSLGLCILALYARFPYMTLLGLAPNWLLIWFVAWSIKQPVILAAIAGISLGLIQDAMTIPSGIGFAPTHILGFTIVGALTALIQKERHIQEDFISIALIVFGMTIISETAIALQLIVFSQNLAWETQQRVTLGTAILSSLWSPVLYFFLNRIFRQN